ncbi:acyl carrier protein [Luteipulveratus mongoliensis]|uniref:Actinorhodin polyketide synthase acyl carrier protein n=1 Tax=Luteipulveratus mongoliensis TaxID=571913 RepID=A0A0K1JFX3_9MICO|nr:acyl carrier protein [Luteipulveratus mongoliensis]AKU15495.1 actinorhodin polyketide synthase acyl carrier protein [Luteipulveratus mongoliensis]
MATFAFEDLVRVLNEGAGLEEGVELTTDVLDTPLSELGYDSLALLETVGRVEREYGVTLDESSASEELTPRDFLDVVNAAQPAVAAAP